MKFLRAMISAFALAIGSIGAAQAQLSQEPAGTVAPSPADVGSAVPNDAAPGQVSPAAPETIPTIGNAPADTTRSGNRLVEEVIVTAQKRNEDIKDVPISISSFNADYLGAKGVLAQQDLPKITPGLTLSSPVGFSTAYIRGIGSDAFILADPLVVTYIDGVYFPASTTQFQDFGSVQKVEIDKGPQGTLFGRNALGGVIAITTTDPDLKSVKAGANSSYNSYVGTDPSRFALNSSGFFSVPITDTLGILVSGLYDHDDPYYNDQVGPTNDRHLIDDGHAWAFRAKVLWKPLDNASIKLNVYRFHESDPQRNFAVNAAPSPLAAGAQAQDAFKGGSIDSVPVSTDSGLTYFGSGELKTHWADIQLVGSHEVITAERNFDFDASPVPIAYFEAVNKGPNKQPFFARNQSIELRFLSNDNAPDWLTLVAGVYYFNQDSGIGRADFQAAGTNLQQGLVAGATLPGLATAFNTLFPSGLINGLPIPQGVQLLLGGGLNDKSLAGYGQGTVKFTDWISLTLGGRYQADKRFILFSDQGLNLNDGEEIFTARYSGENDPEFRTHTNNFDPKVSLNLRPGKGWLGEDPLVYVNYQTATTGNIFNTISLFSKPSLAKGSKLTAYETGLKTTLFDHLISVDTSAFYYNEKNAQSQVVSLQTGGAVHFENVPALQTIGADFSILAQILPSLTDGGLILTLSGAYLDSTYTDYPQGSGFDAAGVYTKYDYKGNSVVQSPKYTTNVGLNQTFQVPGGPFEAGVDFYYNSGFYFFAQNLPSEKQPAYKTVGFTLSYLYEPWKTRVTAFGRNVLNEKYFAAKFTNDFGVDDFAAQLSTYGLTLHWDY